MTVISWLKHPGTLISINGSSFSVSDEKLNEYFIAANVSTNFTCVHDYFIPVPKVAAGAGTNNSDDSDNSNADDTASPETLLACIIYGLEFGNGTELLETWSQDVIISLLNFSDTFLRNSWRLVKCLCKHSDSKLVTNIFDLVKFMRVGKYKESRWESFDTLVSLLFKQFKVDYPTISQRVSDTIVVDAGTAVNKNELSPAIKNGRLVMKFVTSAVQRTVWISFADKIGTLQGNHDTTNFIDYTLNFIMRLLEDGRIFISDNGDYTIRETGTEPKKNTQTEIAMTAVRALTGIYEFCPENWEV